MEDAVALHVSVFHAKAHRGGWLLFLLEKQCHRGELLKLVQVLEEEIALVELVHHGEVFLQPSELPMLLKQPQAYGVERADVHFVHIYGHAFLHEPPGHAGNDFLGGLLGERGHEKLLRLDTLLDDQMHNALDKREDLAGARPGNDEERPLVVGDDGLLLGGRAKVHEAPWDERGYVAW